MYRTNLPCATVRESDELQGVEAKLTWQLCGSQPQLRVMSQRAAF